MTRTLADLLPASGRAAVMGILNITPDSFSDGGQLYSRNSGEPALDETLRRAEAMVAAGADILDVGGESTRPGAAPVSEQEELDRVLPVLCRLRERLSVPLSVDTSTPAVMEAAARAGVSLINDVRALRRPGAIDSAAGTGLPVCLMHMRGEPGSMQDLPVYTDVVAEVRDFLSARAEACCKAGIVQSQIVLDPGFGFGKNLGHNLQLFRALPQLCELGYPVLVGVSRKRMVGEILNRPLGQRLYGSVALAMMAVQSGARIVRVHDVEATVDTLKMYNAVNKESP